MPVYAFVNEQRTAELEFVMSVDELDRRLRTHNGERYIMEDGQLWIFAPFSLGAIRSGTSGYPYTSEAMGVHPVDAQALGDKLEKAGVPTDIKDGCPVITDNGHRTRIMRALKYYDKDAAYSQPTRTY